MKRFLIALLIFICLALGAGVFWVRSTSDRQGPEIRFAEDKNSVYELGPPKSELLEGVTAIDAKDDDVSDTLTIESIFARYTKLIENDGLIIAFEHEEEVFIMGDELRITQVLYNLINNAINYIGEDKTVIVRQTVKDERVRVEVIDHGEGISKENLKYIWDRYYRVTEEHRRAKIGTGLGLSIVKNILIAHDAEYGVESKPGEGSDFWFSMPIIPTDTEE